MFVNEDKAAFNSLRVWLEVAFLALVNDTTYRVSGG